MPAEGGGALPGDGEPIESRFISGGASNEIFEIRRGDHRWALRRPPRIVPEGRNETMLREYRIIEALKVNLFSPHYVIIYPLSGIVLHKNCYISMVIFTYFLFYKNNRKYGF